MKNAIKGNRVFLFISSALFLLCIIAGFGFCEDGLRPFSPASTAEDNPYLATYHAFSGPSQNENSLRYMHEPALPLVPGANADSIPDHTTPLPPPILTPAIKSCKKGYTLDTTGSKVRRAQHYLDTWVSSPMLRIDYENDLDLYMREHVGSYDTDEFIAALDASVCKAINEGSTDVYVFTMASMFHQAQVIMDTVNIGLISDYPDEWRDALGRRPWADTDPEVYSNLRDIEDHTYEVESKKKTKKTYRKNELIQLPDPVSNYLDYLDHTFDPRTSGRIDPRVEEDDISKWEFNASGRASIKIPGHFARDHYLRLHLGGKYKSKDDVFRFDGGIYGHW
ncbi:hypothetical protein ACFL6Y_10530 [Elusimicrobiota bacterium]